MTKPDISAYLRERRSQISRQTRLIRNPSVFSFDYIPKQPLIRTETKQLIDDLLHFELSGIPTHYAIIGSRGSGKTITVKYLQRVLPQQTDLAFMYANCREHNTSFKILAHLLGVSARGTSLSELFERFRQQCPGKMVVVLDEIDVMSPKDRQREILYRLSRSDKPFMVLALANNPHVLIGTDMFDLFTGTLDETQRAKFERVKARAEKLFGEIDMTALVEYPGVFAERWPPNRSVSNRTITLGPPEMLLLSAQPATRAAPNASGVAAILKAFAEEINKLAGSEVFAITESEIASIQTTAITLVNKPREAPDIWLGVA